MDCRLPASFASRRRWLEWVQKAVVSLDADEITTVALTNNLRRRNRRWMILSDS